MLTPQEVAEHGFSKSRMGGYNMKEVDDFLDELTADFSELYKENSVLKGKIKVLAEKISEYRETEDAMRTTLLTAQKMANSGKYDMVLCLGAVIRGSTSHYDLVCNECAKGIAQVSLSAGIPVLFGVVTTDTIEQAIERAGTKAGNKGYDVACSGIEMANLIRSL